jgi:pentatricopeptide repeat protein
MLSVAISTKLKKYQTELLHLIIIDSRHIFTKYKYLANLGNNIAPLWTTIIQAHNSHGNAKEGLRLFHEMKQEGVTPDEYTFASILSVIAELGNLKEGQHIHSQLMVICVPLF